MKKKLVFHIIISMLIRLILILGTLLVNSLILLLCAIPLFIWFCIDLFKWIRITFAVIFFAPKQIVTKGFRYATRERIYILQEKSKYYYSLICFDDIALKGNYIFLEVATFRNGEKLEVTYYPRAKYITNIKRVSIEDKQ